MTDERGAPRDYSDEMEPLAPHGVRLLLVMAGSLFVGLAALGVLLPVLPTTPFLLLAAACYARASPRFYNALLRNPSFGPLIRDWREQRAIPRRAKFTAIALIALTLGSSVAFFVEPPLLRVALGAFGVGLCVWLARQRTPDQPRRLG